MLDVFRLLSLKAAEEWTIAEASAATVAVAAALQVAQARASVGLEGAPVAGTIFLCVRVYSCNSVLQRLDDETGRIGLHVHLVFATNRRKTVLVAHVSCCEKDCDTE